MLQPGMSFSRTRSTLTLLLNYFIGVWASAQTPVPSFDMPDTVCMNTPVKITNTSLDFNRWGQRVFYGRNRDGCWDGNYRGRPQPAGEYVYIIKANTLCGYVTRKGTVMLIR